VSVKVKNISPFGHLDVPLVGRVVEAGEVFDATEEQAALLLMQPFHYAPGDKAAEAFLKALQPAEEVPAVAAPAAESTDASGEGEPA
jgi:hypothetical protein